MFSIFGEILKAVESFPTLVAAGLVDVINGFLAAVGGALTALLSAMQSMGLTMPDIPSIPQGDWLGWLNWLYPVGAAVDILTGAISVYVIWLGVRYLFRLTRFGDD